MLNITSFAPSVKVFVIFIRFLQEKYLLFHHGVHFGPREKFAGKQVSF